jgi:hypothetical protein
MKADTNATASLANAPASSKGRVTTPVRPSKHRSRKLTRRLEPAAPSIMSDSPSERKQLKSGQAQQSQEARKEFGFADAKGRLAARLTETFGTADPALQDQLQSQAASAVTDFEGREIETYDHLSAALYGIRPKDSLEGMLATQMVAVHSLAMTCMGRAAWKDQPDVGIELYLNRATKLMRTFVIQTEALARYRGKGEQKMVVEHVHVHRGGQAIVGPVSQKTENKTDRGEEQ